MTHISLFTYTANSNKNKMRLESNNTHTECVCARVCVHVLLLLLSHIDDIILCVVCACVFVHICMSFLFIDCGMSSFNTAVVSGINDHI